MEAWSGVKAALSALRVRLSTILSTTVARRVYKSLCSIYSLPLRTTKIVSTKVSLEQDSSLAFLSAVLMRSWRSVPIGMIKEGLPLDVPDFNNSMTESRAPQWWTRMTEPAHTLPSTSLNHLLVRTARTAMVRIFYWTLATTKLPSVCRENREHLIQECSLLLSLFLSQRYYLK